MRLLIIGTHPSQTTGYSKVVYNIAKQLGKYPDIKTTIFGIQKFTQVNDDIRLNLPDNVSVWDVHANDKEDFGFGSNSIINFVTINNPDVVMIYNDAEVVSRYIMNLNIAKKNAEEKGMKLRFKIVVYLDQVHTSVRSQTIKFISENSEHVFCFTEKWKSNYLFLTGEYNKDKCSVVRHGIKEPDVISSEDIQKFKVSKNFPQDSFIFLNLNRFALKKRLDISIQAFVKFLKKTGLYNAYLYFPAIIDKNPEILREIYNLELRHAGLSVERYKNNFVVGQTQLSDTDINLIYASCDVGLNTCDGEGFGLCNYEHASYGRPQILSKVGGLLDYFNDTNSLLCTPKIVSYSTEYERGEIVDAEDVAEKMAKYFTTRSLYHKHCNMCSQIPGLYKWDKEVEKMVEVLLNVYKN